MPAAASKTEEKVNPYQEYQDKADRLSKEYDCKVVFETFKEKDAEKKPTGKIFVAYLREPHPLSAIKALDLISAKRVFEAGDMLWGSCFVSEHSSREIESTSKYRLGLMARISNMVDVEFPELKKS